MLLCAAIVAPIAVHVPDSDTWWHLAAGRWMAEHGQVMRTDVLSFTAAGRPWFAHEWLSEVVLAGVADTLGLDALLLAKSLVTLATMALVWALTGRFLAPWPLARMGVGILAFGGIVPVMTPRPWMFSLLLYALLLHLWHRPGTILRRAAPMALVLAVWINLHGMFVLGFLWLALQAAGRLLDAARGRGTTPGDLPVAAAAMAGGALGALVHRYGLRILAYPFIYRGDLTRDIQEWLPPDPSSAYGRYLLLLATVVVGALLRAGAPAASWTTVLGLGALAFSAQRHVPLLALGAVAPLSEALHGLLAAPRRAPADARVLFAWQRFDNFNAVAATAGSRYHLLLLAGVAALTLAGGRTASGGGALFRTAVCDRMYPVSASAWLCARPDAGSRRVLNFYGWGGYLIHERGLATFVDGRTDLFLPDVLADYREVAGVGAGWREVLERHRIDTVLFPAGHALCQVLDAEGTFRPVYRDATAVVLERVR